MIQNQYIKKISPNIHFKLRCAVIGGFQAGQEGKREQGTSGWVGSVRCAGVRGASGAATCL